jgi:hypothetical protein
MLLVVLSYPDLEPGKTTFILNWLSKQSTVVIDIPMYVLKIKDATPKKIFF